MPPYDFTADDADIILRASRCDAQRDFRVHKIILSMVSPVFKEMFDVPQPIPPASPTKPTIPIIDVGDTPEELDIFLRVIYPFGFPTIPTLDAISDVLVTLDKYQVQGGSLQPLRSLLVSPEFLKNDPIRVYSLACRWGFKEEADLAAPYTSSLDVLGRICEEDLRRMTGVEYHRILILEKERRSKCVNYILSLPTSCTGCPGHKKFHSAFRGRLVDNFGVDCRVFYDYGRCVVRCFEIAVETAEVAIPLGCGMGRDSHLGEFIRALAEKTSSHS